jgi:hypothetical protein
MVHIPLCQVEFDAKSLLKEFYELSGPHFPVSLTNILYRETTDRPALVLVLVFVLLGTRNSPRYRPASLHRLYERYGEPRLNALCDAIATVLDAAAPLPDITDTITALFGTFLHDAAVP